MRSYEGKGHTMKRTAVILGVAAAMGVFASAAQGSTGGLPVEKKKNTAVVKPQPVLQTQYNSRSGHTMYRFGGGQLWME